MIIATAAVCLGMDALTFTAMSIAKPYVKRAFGESAKLGVASAHTVAVVHDAVVTRAAAAKHAFKMYRDIVRSV